MRLALIAVAFAFGFATPVSKAGATSLSGSRFVLYENPDQRAGDLRVAEDGGGSFVSMYAYRNGGAFKGYQILARRFDARGRPKGGRIKVFDNADRSADEIAKPTGWLPLADGRSLAAFWTPRSEGDSGDAGGHRGQILDGRALAGPRFSIDRSAPAASPVMGHYLEPMNGGRALALWFDGSLCDCSYARFLSTDGVPADRTINLTDGGLQHLNPHRDGFVATFVKFGGEDSETVAQAYDGRGRKQGARRILVLGPIRELFTTEAVGLADGSILVATHVQTETGWNFVGEMFDGDLNPKGLRRTLRKKVHGHLVSEIVPLEGGDFLSAIHVRDGERGYALELTRYTAGLRAVGAPLRIAVGGTAVRQVLGLASGRVLVVTEDEAMAYGQLVQP